MEHIIRYVPSDHATVLYLHHDRLRPKNVNLDPERYTFLKDSGMSRMQKMIDYVSQDDTCRSSYLLEYFGQAESAPCGTCDVCRNRNSDSSIEESLLKFINEEKGGSYTLDDVKSRFDSPSRYLYSQVLQILRDLIDRNLVPPYSMTRPS